MYGGLHTIERGVRRRHRRPIVRTRMSQSIDLWRSQVFPHSHSPLLSMVVSQNSSIYGNGKATVMTNL